MLLGCLSAAGPGRLCKGTVEGKRHPVKCKWNLDCRIQSGRELWREIYFPARQWSRAYSKSCTEGHFLEWLKQSPHLDFKRAVHTKSLQPVRAPAVLQRSPDAAWVQVSFQLQPNWEGVLWWQPAIHLCIYIKLFSCQKGQFLKPIKGGNNEGGKSFL